MPSSFSTDLRIELQATGENRSTWGTKLNTSLNGIEDAIAGTAAVVMSDANYTLTESNGSIDESRHYMIRLSGTLTQSRTVTIPASSKSYILYNGTSGGYSVVVSNGTNTVTVPNGKTFLIWGNGTAISYYNLTASPTTFAETILDDTSASEVLTTIGGVASASPSFTGTVSLGAGSSLVFEGATDDAYETTVSVADPTADRTITIPDATGTVVLTTGSTFTGGVTFSSTATFGGAVTIAAGGSLTFEGATDDAYETVIAVTDPTADRTITLKDESGTVAFLSDIPSTMDVQTFSASGTWTKPSGVTSSSRVFAQIWSGGASGNQHSGGGEGVGGGGGGYFEYWFNASDLGATESVTVGTGGASALNGNNGGNSTFSTVTVTGGKKPASQSAGDAGGGLSGVSSSNSIYSGGSSGTYKDYGGGGGSPTNTSSGGSSTWGGGGGAGRSGGSGGTSIFGGAGGSSGVAGTAPGGGGGYNAAGADGKIIITTFI